MVLLWVSCRTMYLQDHIMGLLDRMLHRVPWDRVKTCPVVLPMEGLAQKHCMFTVYWKTPLRAKFIYFCPLKGHQCLDGGIQPHAAL